MATISISDLKPTGSELFFDSESYMSELGDSEINIINGGATTSPFCIAVSAGVVASIIVEVSKKVSNPFNSI